MRAPHWLIVVGLVVIGYVLWRKYRGRVTAAVTSATK